MKKIQDLTELRIWIKSKELVLAVYRLTSDFPTNEKFGLISQIQRAAISVMSNIAEGFYRETTKELINFLVIARGSAGEVISHLIISQELGYATERKTKELLDEYERLIISINSLIKSLRVRKK